MKSLNNGIFEFLLDLKSNNNREWFNENKAKFIEHQNTIKTFALDIEKSLNNSDHWIENTCKQKLPLLQCTV